MAEQVEEAVAAAVHVLGGHQAAVLAQLLAEPGARLLEQAHVGEEGKAGRPRLRRARPRKSDMASMALDRRARG